MRRIAIALLALALIAAAGCGATDTTSGEGGRLEPLVIVAAPVGFEGWDQLQRGVVVPADRDEFVDEALILVDAGASVIHIHPLSESPTGPDDYHDYTIEGFDALCEAIRDEAPDIRFEWDFNGAVDPAALREEALDDPYFGSVGNFMGEAYGEGLEIPDPSEERVISSMETAFDHDVRAIPIINTPDDIERLQVIFREVWIPDPQLVSFYFTGGEAIEPTRESYYSARERLPGGAGPVLVVCESDNWRDLADSAIENGDHVRVGFHESEAAESNLEFVVYCAEKARSLERPIATTSQAVTIMGFLR